MGYKKKIGSPWDGLELPVYGLKILDIVSYDDNKIKKFKCFPVAPFLGDADRPQAEPMRLHRFAYGALYQ